MQVRSAHSSPSKPEAVGFLPTSPATPPRAVRHAAGRSITPPPGAAGRLLNAPAISVSEHPSPAAGAAAVVGSGAPEEAPGPAESAQGHHPHSPSSAARPRRRR
ncbi:hypothetical protein GQ55_2G046500 [Panicum hallii var. hallii]|uniref:Uncharacterized protein n=1 Tax=Panicum hallii var. hallii TaxID=1504633 RepID=A0A2T7ELH9_9POAL|nr:hypothetical protein GQ55_2G046500 [Panicum hallii var. hallii]